MDDATKEAVMSDDYHVIIRGEPADDDGLRIEMGRVQRDASMWDLSLPRCPDCGGDMVWYEAGYVPGTRKCLGAPVGRTPDGRPEYDTASGCGSMYSVQIDDGAVYVRRERMY